MKPFLQSRNSAGGEVEAGSGGDWTLRLRAGAEKAYRWAQMDDYIPLPRRKFPWRAPFRLRLQARISEPAAVGTWGFGLWNDPFALNLLGGGTARRLPALPNAAWFFYASPPNFLSLHDNLPRNGFLAQVFRSPRIPAPLLGPGGLALPLLAWSPAARRLRRVARTVVREDAARVPVDVTQWHAYELQWLDEAVRFGVDGDEVLATTVAPRGPLGLVLWIDNQYLAFPPDGRLRVGLLPVRSDTILELREINVE